MKKQVHLQLQIINNKSLFFLTFLLISNIFIATSFITRSLYPVFISWAWLIGAIIVGFTK